MLTFTSPVQKSKVYLGTSANINLEDNASLSLENFHCNDVRWYKGRSRDGESVTMLDMIRSAYVELTRKHITLPSKLNIIVNNVIFISTAQVITKPVAIARSIHQFPTDH